MIEGFISLSPYIYISLHYKSEKRQSKFLFSCYSIKHWSDGDCSSDSPPMGIPLDLKGNDELKIIYSYSVRFVNVSYSSK